MLDQFRVYFKRFMEKGLFHILTGSFLTKLVSFFGSVFLVRVLSKTDYGILSYLENIYGYIYVFAGMGLSNAVLRYVVLGKDHESKYKYFGYACKIGFLWNLGLGLIASAVLLIYPHPEKYAEYTWLLGLFLLMLPFQYLTDNALANERAMLANRRYAVSSLILASSVIFVKIISGWLGGIYAIPFAQFSVYLLLAAVFVFSAKHLYFKGIVPAPMAREEKKEVNRYSFQYMITNSLWAIFMLNEIFILGRFCDPVAVADYKVAYTIPGCVSIISSSLGIFVAPYFVKNENNLLWIRQSFKKLYLASMVVIGGICLILAVFAKPVVWLLYGDAYLNITGLMQVLLVAAFLNNGMRYTVANLLAAMGQIKYNMIVSVSAVLLQVIVVGCVAPIYGGIGVASASCLIYLYMAIILLGVFLKKYYFSEIK